MLKMKLKGLSFRELKDVLQGACRFTERKIVSLFLQKPTVYECVMIFTLSGNKSCLFVSR